MTICIGAICEEDNEASKVVVAADRMVTRGGESPKEFEHTNSKLQKYTDFDQINAITLGAGVSSLIDEFNENLESILSIQEEDITQELFVECARSAYRNTIDQRINHSMLETYGVKANDLIGNDNISDDMAMAIMQDIDDKRSQLRNNLQVIVTGVAEGESFLSVIANGAASNLKSTSFTAVGSGKEPAESAFIHSEYDSSCNVDEALLHVFEAKKRAEEAQGVGDEKTDLGVVYEGGYYEVEGDDLEEIENTFREFNEGVKELRNEYIKDGSGNVAL